MFCWIWSEKGGLCLAGVEDEVVVFGPVCDAVEIWLEYCFCCPVVGVGGCDCYVIGISCEVDKWIGGGGDV